MSKEYDILKKLAKGLENKPESKGSKNKDTESEQEIETTKYQAIPLRTLETIMNETTNQEKKD